MGDIQLRAIRPADYDAVASLVCLSTNHWYQVNRNMRIFTAGPASCRLFVDVYEALDPGCCVLAVESHNGREEIAGSCFYHPRPTHVSLGIMNVHPNFAGRGIASKLLRFITDYADREQKPVRLVSSAMNLDSFSLYSRAGFVPRTILADMLIPVPPDGFKPPVLLQQTGKIRPALPKDVPAIAALEEKIAHIRRDQDYTFFIENRQNIWHALVHENASGQIDGFLCSVIHPASNMIGPGVMASDEVALELLAAELDHNRGRSPVFLVPLDHPQLVKSLYAWGAKNVELHFAQVRGHFEPFAPAGVTMPTFMPETA